MPVTPFDPAQGKSATGNQPVANSAPSMPSFSGPSGFIKIPIEPLFSGIGHILFLAAVVSVIGVSIFFLGISNYQKSGKAGNSSGKVGELVPPINVAEINFPSEFQRDIFLKNFQDAGKTGNYQERYKLLQDDYSRLLGFYTGDHDPKTRKVLEQYAQYMINNYPEHAQERIYTTPCFDSGCGTAKYPDEIKKIKDEVAGGNFDNTFKDGLDKSFEAAALSSDKNLQWSTYINALSSVKSYYDVGKSEAVLALYRQLAAFIEKTYPDFKIPPQIRIGQ